ncbi:MAG: protein phosphatase 2C domain-containing protein [Nostocaceae cyanobacterium]|nr:protein phosphatase 2C domain-containing protein [Nostocaceae cyanobacterium]
MISTQRIVYCTNLDCTSPINPVGEAVCANCETPLVYRYLWAVGSSTADLSVGEKIANRYEIISPNIWLDTQPGLLADVPQKLSGEITRYLRLYPQRLHIPQVYGFAQSRELGDSNILLLENVPIDDYGNLYPAITKAWAQATGVRQVYWLWQILQLWQPLSELGVAASLLRPDNLRVQGWCVRLLELYPADTLSLQQLGESWSPLIGAAKSQVSSELQKIIQQMLTGEGDLQSISSHLNKLLLSAAAHLPLTLKVAGATDIGVEPTQNEDACFPTGSDSIEDPLLPRVSIVCDGIGGHEGGEVASKLALQSVKLQIRALLREVAQQVEIIPPDLLQQQMEASLRVANNVICNSNNEQKREGIQRMGTTMLMAIQVPQQLETASGWRSENAHELYLVNVGDSRAYWITTNCCQLLTVDDDVVAREVGFGRSLYRQALQGEDATALTQALGAKDGEFLRPQMQRLILEEDGILLLCSDGLSDNHLVEQYWRDYAVPILTGEILLEEAVHQWIQLANRENGDDNISVVLTHCRVSPDYPVQVIRTPATQEVQIVSQHEVVSTFAESSQALLDLGVEEEGIESEPTPASAATATISKPKQKRWLLWIGLLVVLLGGTGLGLFALWRFYPQSFQQLCRRFPNRLEKFCPPEE